MSYPQNREIVDGLKRNLNGNIVWSNEVFPPDITQPPSNAVSEANAASRQQNHVRFNEHLTATHFV